MQNQVQKGCEEKRRNRDPASKLATLKRRTKVKENEHLTSPSTLTSTWQKPGLKKRKRERKPSRFLKVQTHLARVERSAASACEGR